MNALRSLKGWFLRHKKRIAEVGTGMTLYAIFNWIFNYPVYMWVIGMYGMVNGGLLMTLFSFVQCASFLIMFDKMRIDWVGVSYIDDVVNKENKNRIERWIVWAVRKEHQTFTGNLTKFIGFVVFSIYVDPFVVAVHYRKEQFNGVTKRDWRVLTSAVLIANVWWTLRTGLLVALALGGWELIKTRFGY